MTQGKYYSLHDLANLAGQPRSTVAEVMRFLTKYGFVKRIGATEPVFTKSNVKFSPGESINLLRCLPNP
jgi:hypothetical protein